MVNSIIEAGVNTTKHAILRTISVLCVLAVIGLLILGVKRILYPKPTESYHQKAEQIQNYEYTYNYDDRNMAFFGIKIWKIKLGITIK